jgi:single-strand DNA-binding protein
MYEIEVTVTGQVGTDVDHRETNGGPLTTFRLASTPRRYDRSQGAWLDEPTTWFSVQCWRGLATNVKSSISKGQPVVVTGRLRTSEWTQEGETHSRLVLDAATVGHDLNRGTSVFHRSTPRQAEAVSETAEAVAALQLVETQPASAGAGAANIA